MPYTNIVFVKLQMELFEEDRFLIDLNDTQKGLYLMLLGLAGKTKNKIRNDVSFIKERLHLNSLKESDLLKISEIFPKFYLKNGYWKFRKFEAIHNYCIDKKGKSQGNPEELHGIGQNKKKKENKKQNSDGNPIPSTTTKKERKEECFICHATVTPREKSEHLLKHTAERIGAR